MDLSGYSITSLKQIIRSYNLHYHIKGFSKMKRGELEKVINDFMEFVDGFLISKKRTKIAIPKKNERQVRQPKTRLEKKRKTKVRTIVIEEEDEQDNNESQPIIDNKQDENTYLIQNWQDKHLGIITANTKIGQNIENAIHKLNKKGHYVVQTALVSFLKPIANDIIDKYGVDAFFKGVNNIADYYDAQKFVEKFGKEESLGLANYLNKKNLKKVIDRNIQLLQQKGEKIELYKHKLPEIHKNTVEDYLKFNKFITTIVNNAVKKKYNSLPQTAQLRLTYAYAKQFTKAWTDEILKSKDFKDKLHKKYKQSEIASLKHNYEIYENYIKSLPSYKQLYYKDSNELMEKVLNIEK